MIVGYARTSSVGQIAGLEAQERELRAAGCDKIFREQVSSVAERQQLEAALDYVRDGDQFVCTKLDRLARSVGDLLAIVARLEAKKVGLRILSMSGAQSLDTSTATGRLMLAVIGAVGQAEREAMLERQREGIAKAKREGRYKGRVPTARRQAAETSGSWRRASGRRKSPLSWASAGPASIGSWHQSRTVIRWLREAAGEVLRVGDRSLEVRRHTMPERLGADRLVGRQSIQ
jgi:DNA invertase Pin-like site-specific DNA recombinase